MTATMDQPITRRPVTGAVLELRDGSRVHGDGEAQVHALRSVRTGLRCGCPPAEARGLEPRVSWTVVVVALLLGADPVEEAYRSRASGSSSTA